MSTGDQGPESLPGLDAVNWPVVISPGNAKRHGPQLVVDLWRPEAATSAARTLRQLCAMGDHLFPAAAEMLPFMAMAAADPAVTVRAQLIESVGEIAATAARAKASGRQVRLPAMASLRTGPQPSPAEQARTAPPSRAAASWPSVWDRAVTALCPLLDDPSWEVRRSVAVTLAQAVDRAEEITRLLQAGCGSEHVAAVAEQLVESIGWLAAHTGRRQEIVAWLRARMTWQIPVDTDTDTDTDADSSPDVDVRLAAVRALRRVLPGYDDPAYARAVSQVLLDPGWTPSHQRGELFDLGTSEVCAVDELLGGDLPGRLSLARALLRHDRPERRTCGLELAAKLMADRRSAVPALLSEVARLVDDPLPDHRALALRVLAMCGTVSHPWADAVASHATQDGEPDPLVRTQALWALGKMGDDRCVPVLAERMAANPRRERREGFRDWVPESNVGRWSDLELNFCELLGILAAHQHVLLAPLMVKMASRHDRLHYPLVLARWHREGAPVVPELVELLDSEIGLWAARALAVIAPGPVAVGREQRLRRMLGPLGPSQHDREHIDPVAYWRLTGDAEPVRVALRSERLVPWYRAQICAELGPAAAGEAERLRREVRDLLLVRPAMSVRHLHALWRITGETDEVVPELLKLSAPPAQGTGTAAAADSPQALIALAEIAIADLAVADLVSDRLRSAMRRTRQLGHERTLALARVLWKLSGRAEEIVPALMALVDRLTEPSGWLPPTRLEPLVLLAEIAAADPDGVASALHSLRALVDTDERPVTYRNWRPEARRHWRSVEDDDALRTAVGAVLDAASRRTRNRLAR